MAELKWIQISLFLTTLPQSAAAAETRPRSVTVRAGDDVSLPCDGVAARHGDCVSASWLFGSGHAAAVELLELGRVGNDSRAESDGPSVTGNCSLVVQKVTVQDAGRYLCRRSNESGQREPPDVLLSVVTMTEEKDSDDVTFTCSVSTSGRCQHTVKWLFNGNEVEGDRRRAKTPPCSASVSFHSARWSSLFRFLKCEVTAGDRAQLFPFRLQPSGGHEPATRKPLRAVVMTPRSAAIKHLQELWWFYFLVVVVSVELLLKVVKFIRRRRTGGNATGQNEDLAGAEEGGPSTSSQVRSEDDDDDDEAVPCRPQ